VDVRTNSDYFPNWVVFITDTVCVYSAVRTEPLSTLKTLLHMIRSGIESNVAIRKTSYRDEILISLG
jgi:hypothetical protein